MPTVRQFTPRNQPWSGQESRISQSKAEAAGSLLLLFAKLGLRGRVIHLQLEMMQGREEKKKRGEREHAIPLIQSARNKEVLVPSNLEIHRF